MKKRILSLVLLCSLVFTGLALPTTVGAANPTNVAAYKQVHVYSDAGYKDETTSMNYPVSKNFLVDGDNSQFAKQYVSEWVKSPFKTQYIAIELVDVYEVNCVQLATPKDGGLPAKFTLCVYNGTEWISVYSGTAPTDGSDKGKLHKFTFSAVTCNAVKLVVEELSKPTEENESYVLRLTEMEVYGVPSSSKLKLPTFTEPDDIAIAEQGTTVEVSERWTEEMVSLGYGPSAIIDGREGPGTKFFGISATTDSSKEVTVTLNLDKVYRINEIQLFPADDGDYYGGGFPVGFVLEGSKDGSSWETIMDVSDFPEELSGLNSLSFHFADRNCKAVRLRTTELGAYKDTSGVVEGQYVFRLGEFSVCAPAVYTEIQSDGTAFASSSTEYETVGLRYVNDGDAEYGRNYYATAPFGNTESSEYVGVSYEKAHWFNSVTIESYYDEFPTAFKISVYDGTVWKDVKAVKSAPTEAEGKTFQFAVVRGTAIKVTAERLQLDRNQTGEYYFKLAELRVQGKQVKAGVTLAQPDVSLKNACIDAVVAGGSTGAAEGAFYASASLTTADNYEWLQVEFIHPVKAQSVVFSVTQVFPKDFKMQAYNGTEWVSLFEQTEYTKECYRFGFQAIECSAVRFIATELSSWNNEDYALLIQDMQVFAAETTNTVADPPTLSVRKNLSPESRVLSWGIDEARLYDGEKGEEYYTSQATWQTGEVQVQFLFEKSTYIERVRFYVPPNEKCPTNIKIFAFTGSEWQKQKEITGYESTESEESTRHEFSFEPVACSGLVVVVGGLDKIGEEYRFRMSEIELVGYGENATSAVLGDMNGDGSLTDADLSGVRQKLMGKGSAISIDFDMTWEENILDIIRAKRYFNKVNS